jgi:Rad3-related DNA helicase
MKSNKSPVLLSPILSTGWDFPDDLCRFIIIPKLPFAPTNDLVSKCRRALDKDYANHEVVIEFTQMCGRGSRHLHDWCVTYFLDTAWSSWFQAATAGRRPKSLIVKHVVNLPERVHYTDEYKGVVGV